MKHKVLVQGSYGCIGKLPQECIDFIESKGEKYPDILKTRHHPVLIEMFEKFSEYINPKKPEFGKCLYGLPDGKLGSYRGYYLLQEIEGDVYTITNYDGAEGANTPEDFNWIHIK